MMANKTRLSMIVVILIMIGFLSIAQEQSSSAQECKVVTISGMNLIQLEPAALTVSKGTCVVWFSRSVANQLTISFADGKKCDEVTDAASGFILNQQSCYTSTDITTEGTASLRFLETGTYPYSIFLDDGKKVAEGTVTVQ